MNAALLLAAVVQAAGAPQVGDTVWIDREIRAEAGSLLRPLPWDPGEGASLLAPPEARVQPGGWLLRYPLAFWRAGTHRLVVPGPLVIRPDGGTDTLPPRTVEVEVASLLPRGRTDTLPPEPAADLLPSGERTPQPILVLLGLAATVLAPLHWWWRRRGPRAPVAAPARSGVLATPAQLTEWAQAGELRLAADGWIARLEEGPSSPDRTALLTALRQARFETGDRETLARLCAEAARS